MFQGGRYGIDPDLSFLKELSKQNLGNNATIAVGSNTADIELCRVQMPTQFARGWIVTLSPPTTEIPPGVGDHPPVLGLATAVIQYGTAGISTTFECDWANGVRFGLFASNVTVRINSAGGILLITGSLTFGASLTPGTWGGMSTSGSPVTRSFAGSDAATGDPGLPAGALSTIVPVPALARAVKVCFVPTVGAPTEAFNFTIHQGTLLGGAVLTESCRYAFSGPPGASSPQRSPPFWVPLEHNVNAVQIENTNSNPNDWRTFGVSFALGL